MAKNFKQAVQEGMLTDEVLLDAESWYLKLTDSSVTGLQKQQFKTWYYENSLHEQAYAQVFVAHDAGLTLSDDKPVARPANDNFRLTSLVLGAIAASFFIIIMGINYSTSTPNLTEFSTQVAEIRQVRLEDGSALTLGAATKILVTDFEREGRQVRILNGEALFDVAHDVKNPFTVISGDTEVRVLGTKFTVNTAPNHLSVSLLSGKVEVRQQQEKGLNPFLDTDTVVELKPEQSIVVANGVVGEPTTKDIKQMTDWIGGKRSYFNQPLSIVIADMNRYVGNPIDITDGSAENLKVTLVFDLNQIEDVLANLPNIIPVEVIVNEKNTIIRNIQN